MGNSAGALRLVEPREEGRQAEECLLGMHSEVSPDGEAVVFTVEYTNHQPIRVQMPYCQAVAITDELQARTAEMAERQALNSPDWGAAFILGLCRDAERPAVIQIHVDPMTKDRVFLFQFEERAPVTIRVPFVELPGMLAELARAMARSIN